MTAEIIRDLEGGPIFLLRDKQGGASWWCYSCGSRGMGRMLPGTWHPRDIRRLAEGHLKRHPKCKGVKL